MSTEVAYATEWQSQSETHKQAVSLPVRADTGRVSDKLVMFKLRQFWSCIIRGKHLTSEKPESNGWIKLHCICGWDKVDSNRNSYGGMQHRNILWWLFRSYRGD